MSSISLENPKMGDSSPKSRSRKIGSFRGLIDSDSNDDDFKERVPSNNKSKLASKSRLKLVGTSKATRDPPQSLLPRDSDVGDAPGNDKKHPEEAPQQGGFDEVNLTVAEPDLIAHGFSSQETVILSSCETVSDPDSVTAEKVCLDSPKPCPDNFSEAEKESASESLDSSSDEEIRKKRKRKQISKKRKLSSHPSKNETKKIKVDSNVKEAKNKITSKPQTLEVKVQELNIHPKSLNRNPLIVDCGLSKHAPLDECETTKTRQGQQPKTELVELELVGKSRMKVLEKEVETTRLKPTFDKSVETKGSKLIVANTTNETKGLIETLSSKDDAKTKSSPSQTATVLNIKRTSSKAPVWNPPGKVNNSSKTVSNSSPTIGLRLGLSRNSRLKPLHRTGTHS